MEKDIKEIKENNLELTVNDKGLLTTKQAATWLGYKPRMLEVRRLKGDGPLFIRISARAVRYRLKDLQSWVNARLRTSTSQV